MDGFRNSVVSFLVVVVAVLLSSCAIRKSVNPVSPVCQDPGRDYQQPAVMRVGRAYYDNDIARIQTNYETMVGSPDESQWVPREKPARMLGWVKEKPRAKRMHRKLRHKLVVRARRKARRKKKPSVLCPTKAKNNVTAKDHGAKTPVKTATVSTHKSEAKPTKPRTRHGKYKETTLFYGMMKFPAGKSTVPKSEDAVIDAVSALLHSSPHAFVRLMGHATGGNDHGINIANARVQAVRNKLVAVDPKAKVQGVNLGDRMPVYQPGKAPENNLVELVVIEPE